MQHTSQQPTKRRVLSMWQPWASLLVAGIKQVESRGRNTEFRGEFLVHATQSLPKTGYDIYLRDEEFRRYVNDFLQLGEIKPLSCRDLLKLLPTGAIIGSANLVESLPSWDLKERWEEAGRLIDWEREFVLGNHGSHRFAWLCKEHKRFEYHTPVKGCQSILWSLPDGFVLNS